MARELIINASLPETRIALLEEGKVQELLIERSTDRGIVGNIYKGRVTRVLPGMQAAFVDIGLEKAAFLYVDDVYFYPNRATEGDDELKLDHGSDEEQDETGENASDEGSGSENESGAEGEADAEGENFAEAEMAAESESDSGISMGVSTESSGRGATIAPVVPSAMDDFVEEADSMELDSDDLDDDEEESDDLDEESLEASSQIEDASEESELGNQSEGEATREAGGEADGNRIEQTSFDPSLPVEAGASDEENLEGQTQSETSEGTTAQEPMRIKPRDPNAPLPPQDPNQRRGRRGGRFRRGGRGGRGGDSRRGGQAPRGPIPNEYYSKVGETGSLESDRAVLDPDANEGTGDSKTPRVDAHGNPIRARREFREFRSRDKRVRSKASLNRHQEQVNIQDLLQEGQEIIVQVAKDPIATKGARLTCHVSLPGRHLVCMPTINHVGVSRRIEHDHERRYLRDFVDKNRPDGMGFIVRTASGSRDSEKWIKHDIDYLAQLWTDVRAKVDSVTAPALVYEDLNSSLRAMRDWVTEEIDRIIVDSRYHYNEMRNFVSKFMPGLSEKVELYHGDIPVFDAYGISTELHRALERKVWLKSGGYIVIDQAEALVAIDVNTGRFVGRKNLEDTILKTNIEAVEEIAYQLRLRNCGGIIIIDFIDMEKDENRQRVYRALDLALQKDRARPTIMKISDLGLVEMTRKRTRDTMVRALCESCSHCEGKGFVKSKQTVAYEILREIERTGIDRDIKKVLVNAHASVIDILAIDEKDTLDYLERRYRKQIYLQAVGDFHHEQFEVTGDRVGTARPFVTIERAERNARHDRGDRYDRKRRSQRNDRGDRSARHDRGDRYDRNDRNERQDRNDQIRSDAPRPKITPLEPRVKTESGIEPPAIENAPQDEVMKNQNLEAGNENVGNAQTDFNPNQGGESDGNLVNEGNTIEHAGDEYEEEDRLAFLRAQAAQDAAIAGKAPAQGAGGFSRNRPRNARGDNRGGGGRGGRMGGGGGRTPGGRSGGRGGFRRNANGRGGGQGFGNGRYRNQGGGGGFRPGPRADFGVVAAPMDSGPGIVGEPGGSTSGSGSGTDSGSTE